MFATRYFNVDWTGKWFSDNGLFVDFVAAVSLLQQWYNNMK
jgi:hypothetical protein